MSSTKLRLITIRFSHFCEKARWALDRYHVPYVEEAYMPMLHIVPVLAATRGNGKKDEISSPASTPVLIKEDGSCICDSAEIVEYVSTRFSDKQNSAKLPLYEIPSLPAEEQAEAAKEIKALEKRFHDSLGPTTRRVAYYYLFQDDALCKTFADGNVGSLQAISWKLGLALIKQGITSSLNINKETLQAGIEEIRKEFAFVEQRLKEQEAKWAPKQQAQTEESSATSITSTNAEASPSPPSAKVYLLGNQFTAADLAFAALSAPILFVTPEEGYGGLLPAISKIPKELQQIVLEMRDTVAGKYALRLFAEEHGVRQIHCEPRLPTKNTQSS